MRLADLLNSNSFKESQQSSQEGSKTASPTAAEAIAAEESKCALQASPTTIVSGSSGARPLLLLQAYTFTDYGGSAQSNQCRFFRFDETTEGTVSEATLLTLAAATEKQLHTLMDHTATAAGAIGNSNSAEDLGGNHQ